MEVTVIITTWGTSDWEEAGRRCQFETTLTCDARVFHLHRDEPDSAGAHRNAAVDEIDPPDWICFLDADDRLASGYIEAMFAEPHRTNQLLTPALALGDRKPHILEGRDIIKGNNPCPIGTLIHREAFELAGRFWDERAWEDWSLFRRAVLVGAEIVFVPEAIYIATYDRRGRNSTVVNPQRLRRQIVRSHLEWIEP